ncbi:MAG: hypothetical protein QJR05_14865 [Thermoanaerobacterium sp.]|nr:hypothetical protein [Thermoanaerobacterium sp.]
MDTTWGVKMSEELKEKISKLIEQSGLSAKDFMGELVQTYEAKMTRNAVPQIASDIEEVQALTKRLLDIYINVGQKILNLQNTKNEEINKEIAKKNSLIETLQSKIAELEIKNKDINQKLQDYVNHINSLELEVNRVNEVNKSNKALIDEYKAKIDTLSALINEYKGFKEENNNLKTENKNLKDEYTILKNELENKEKALNDFKREIEFLKKQAIVDKGMALLELDKKYQEELKSIKDEYTNKIEALQEEINDLLFEKEEYIKAISEKNL